MEQQSGFDGLRGLWGKRGEKEEMNDMRERERKSNQGEAGIEGNVIVKTMGCAARYGFCGWRWKENGK